MNINELNLISFGKFKNKKVELTKGLNIIYGENEAGKTTIHNFIDGMFYGFLKPNVKNTLYLEEHGKYKPWHSSNYSGVIKLESFSDNYIIERNFTKSQEETKVLLESTGEDITYNINQGQKVRILQPGFHFMGFNNAVYSNTISIKQLDLKTDNKLANELREKLVNIGSALDEDISVEGAIDELNRALKSIGSIKAPTSIYNKENEKRINLQYEKEEILSLRNFYDALIRENSELENRIEVFNKKIKNLTYRKNNARIIEIREKYKEIKSLENEINTLEKESEGYIAYNNLSMDDYAKCIKISSNIEHLKDRKEELLIHHKKIDIEIHSLSFKNKDYENLDLDLLHDYMVFQKLEENINILQQNDNRDKIELVNANYKSTKSLKSGLILTFTVMVLLLVALIVYSFINNKPGFLGISPFLAILITYIFWRLRKATNRFSRTESQKNDLEALNRGLKDETEKYKNYMNRILKKYEVGEILNLTTLYDELSLKLLRKEELENKLSKLIQESLEIQRHLNSINEKQNLEQNMLEELFLHNNSDTIENFKFGLENKQKYGEHLEKIKSKKDLLYSLLGNSNMDDLIIELENFGDYHKVKEELFGAELEIKLANLKEELVNTRLNKKGIEKDIWNLDEKVSNLVNVEEDLKRTSLKLKEFDHKIGALELAKKTIENLSKNIHKQFAPTINRRVGNVISEITNGKYKIVKIDPNLEISVTNPETGQIVSINNLSGGTIDQLYFSLRFGIIKSMADKKLPLILDDCFIQYDDVRLENILEFLLKISNERQIILFTCQKREIELLDKLDRDYNLIYL